MCECVFASACTRVSADRKVLSVSQEMCAAERHLQYTSTHTVHMYMSGVSVHGSVFKRSQESLV